MPYSRARYLAAKADPEWQAVVKGYRKKLYAETRANPVAMAAKAAYQREWNFRARCDPGRWLRLALTTAKSRAKRRGVTFDIAPEDVKTPAYCPITLRLLNYGCKSRDRSGPSLDRVDPTLGYVAGNVRIISLLANVMKQDCADPAVFERIAAYLRVAM